MHAKSSVTQREVAAAREHAPPQRRWENPTVSVNAKLGGRGEAEKLEKKVWHSSSYTEVTVDLTFVALSAEEKRRVGHNKSENFLPPTKALRVGPN